MTLTKIIVISVKMQAPGDNAISIVEPQTTYADNNLNEKTLSTQYIYTTEGQLIPATQEVVSANMDLNPQVINILSLTYITSLIFIGFMLQMFVCN